MSLRASFGAGAIILALVGASCTSVTTISGPAAHEPANTEAVPSEPLDTTSSGTGDVATADGEAQATTATSTDEDEPREVMPDIEPVEDSAAALTEIRAAIGQTMVEPGLSYERLSQHSGHRVVTYTGSFDRTRQTGERVSANQFGDLSRADKLIDGVVWIEDSDPANNRLLGLDEDSTSSRRDSVREAIDPAWMLRLVDDALIEVVGVEDLGDGAERWFVLADVAALGEFASTRDFGFDDDDTATGTSFDQSIVQLTVADNMLTGIAVNLAGLAEARRLNAQWYEAPERLSEDITFESIPVPSGITAPCPDPIRSSAEYLGSVLQCPVDESAGVQRFVTIGYRPFPSSSTQVFILEQLLSDLGYRVSVDRTSVAADGQYDEIADGEQDVWAAGWFPWDQAELEHEHPDGGTIGDRLTRGEPVVAAAGTAGFWCQRRGPIHGLCRRSIRSTLTRSCTSNSTPMETERERFLVVTPDGHALSGSRRRRLRHGQTSSPNCGRSSALRMTSATSPDRANPRSWLPQPPMPEPSSSMSVV